MATKSGNTMWTKNGTVTSSGNMIWTPNGTYNFSGGVIYGPNGETWTGVTSKDDAMSIIAHELK